MPAVFFGPGNPWGNFGFEQPALVVPKPSHIFCRLENDQYNGANTYFHFPNPQFHQSLKQQKEASTSSVLPKSSLWDGSQSRSSPGDIAGLIQSASLGSFERPEMCSGIMSPPSFQPRILLPTPFLKNRREIGS